MGDRGGGSEQIGQDLDRTEPDRDISLDVLNLASLLLLTPSFSDTWLAGTFVSGSVQDREGSGGESGSEAREKAGQSLSPPGSRYPEITHSS